MKGGGYMQSSAKKGTRGGSPARQASNSKLPVANVPFNQSFEQDQSLRVNENNDPPQQIMQPVPTSKPVGQDVKVGSHLTDSSVLETGFPVFPPGTKSLLS